jgi:hypothetical protein
MEAMPSEGLSSRDALDHAWHWFEYHANQRMTMIRFYIIVAGAIATGIGYLWQAEYYFLVSILSLFGTVTSFAFIRLDKRVSDLVHIGEAALKVTQKELATALGSADMNICVHANANRNANNSRRQFWPYTYSENIQLIIAFCMSAFAIACLAGLTTGIGHLHQDP